MCVDVQNVYDFFLKGIIEKRLVLTTLDFEINIHHPYKPLVVAIRKFQVATNTLASVAWNFMNNG
jgi:cyclin T